jgi:hypothetical protein
MTSFAGRFVAHVVAITLVPMAAVTVAAPGVSSPQCDPAVYTHCETSLPQCDPNWSRNVWTNECKPPPPPPAWWTPRPAYAPPYAPLDVPPPPPPPPWAQQLHPIWDEGGQHWVWIGI